MKFKKTIAVLLAITMIFSLAACSKSKSPTETGESSSPETSEQNTVTNEGGSSGITEDEVELRFMWWGDDTRHEATMEVIKQYEALHPNVKIDAEYSGYDGYFEKLSTQLTGEKAADIIQYDASMTVDLLKFNNAFIDLKTLSTYLNTSDFDQKFLENFGIHDGKLIGIPTGMNAGICLVNKAVTDAAGIDITSKDLTWDQFIDAGIALNTKNSDQYLLNYDITTLGKEFIFSTLAQLTGKEIIDSNTMQLNFTRDDLYKVFSLIDSLYKNKVLEPASDSAPYDSQLNTNPKWISHDLAAAFSVTSLTTSSYYDFQDTAAVINMPQFENAFENGVILRPAQLIGISSGCKYPEVAADFLNYFFNSDEAAKVLKDCRSVPATANARNICESEGYLDKNIVKAVELAQELATENQNLSVPNEITEILKDATASIAYNQSSVDEITDNTMSLLEDTLARLKKE